MAVKQTDKLRRHLFPVLLLLVGFTACDRSGNSSATSPMDIDYLPAAHGVTYRELESLAYRQPDESIPYGENALQFGELWLPANGSDPAGVPLVVFIHGGCWLNAYDIRHSYALGTALAQAGFAVWSLEYRRTGDEGGGWPGSFEDVLAGIRAIDALAARGIDVKRPVISGHSAGGHLALLAGSHFPQAAAVIGLAAITDIVDYASGENTCQAAAALFMGGEFFGNELRYQEANPAAAPLHLNTRLLHGAADAIVPLSQAGLTGAETIIEDAAAHFDWVYPGTDAFSVFVGQLKEITSQ